jgi:hypothetical protein
MMTRPTQTPAINSMSYTNQQAQPYFAAWHIQASGNQKLGGDAVIDDFCKGGQHSRGSEVIPISLENYADKVPDKFITKGSKLPPFFVMHVSGKEQTIMAHLSTLMSQLEINSDILEYLRPSFTPNLQQTVTAVSRFLKSRDRVVSNFFEIGPQRNKTDIAQELLVFFKQNVIDTSAAILKYYDPGTERFPDDMFDQIQRDYNINVNA